MTVFDYESFNDANKKIEQFVCLCESACFHRNENFACGEMKMNKLAKCAFS